MFVTHRRIVVYISDSELISLGGISKGIIRINDKVRTHNDKNSEKLTGKDAKIFWVGMLVLPNSNAKAIQEHILEERVCKRE